MFEALAAERPYPEYADKLTLFGRLVGSWDIVCRFFDESGNVTRETVGEWHFGWVLEGRAMQDVFITPPRDRRAPGQESGEYGTTICAYDPKIDGWRATCVAPVGGATVNLIAREHGYEIWLEGRSPENDLWRWTFSDFSDERVRWQAYVSKDEGRSWLRGEEIILTRRPQPRR